MRLQHQQLNQSADKLQHPFKNVNKDGVCVLVICCASVDNHIPQYDIFDYHPIRECTIYTSSPMGNEFTMEPA